MTSGKGILVAFEGIDGAGKTTQVQILRRALEQAGESVEVSKEPTDSEWGRVIKESATSGRLSAEAELDAFLKDRTQHVRTTIAPALEAGRILLLDRYFYSSIAYQGARGIDYTAIRATMEARFPIPDAVFILDINPALGLHRIAHSRGETPNQFEKQTELEEARAIFGNLHAREIHHIDGSASVSQVHRTVLNVLIEGAFKAKRCAKEYGCDNPFECAYRLSDSCEWVRLRKVLASLDTPLVSVPG
ncbi:MAG: dTMP kinase [Bryobacteraceae bacterium]